MKWGCCSDLSSLKREDNFIRVQWPKTPVTNLDCRHIMHPVDCRAPCSAHVCGRLTRILMRWYQQQPKNLPDWCPARGPWHVLRLLSESSSPSAEIDGQSQSLVWPFSSASYYNPCPALPVPGAPSAHPPIYASFTHLLCTPAMPPLLPHLHLQPWPWLQKTQVFLVAYLVNCGQCLPLLQATYNNVTVLWPLGPKNNLYDGRPVDAFSNWRFCLLLQSA